MLPKKLRVPIQKFPKNSKTLLRGNFIVVKFAKNNLGYDRIGVVVSKKAAKKPTQRNKIRREVFHLFQFSKNRGSGGRDALIIVNSHPEDRESFLNEVALAKEKIEN